MPRLRDYTLGGPVVGRHAVALIAAQHGRSTASRYTRRRTRQSCWILNVDGRVQPSGSLVSVVMRAYVLLFAVVRVDLRDAGVGQGLREVGRALPRHDPAVVAHRGVRARPEAVRDRTGAPPPTLRPDLCDPGFGAVFGSLLDSKTTRWFLALRTGLRLVPWPWLTCVMLPSRPLRNICRAPRFPVPRGRRWIRRRIRPVARPSDYVRARWIVRKYSCRSGVFEEPASPDARAIPSGVASLPLSNANARPDDATAGLALSPASATGVCRLHDVGTRCSPR